jgi:hypothetical protein
MGPHRLMRWRHEGVLGGALEPVSGSGALVALHGPLEPSYDSAALKGIQGVLKEH